MNKLQLGMPVVVTQGMTHEECDWGAYQFPRVYNQNGTLYVAVNTGKDEWGELDSNHEAWFISHDKGQTWQRTDSATAERECGMTMPNGDQVFFPMGCGRDLYHMKHSPTQQFHRVLPGDRQEKAQPGYLPMPAGFRVDAISGSKILTYDLDYMSEEFDDDRTFPALRIPAGENEPIEERQTLNWPHQPFQMWWNDTNKNSCSLANSATGAGTGSARIAPDGSVWLFKHSNLDPETGAYSYYSSAILLTSNDNGHTWNYKTRIPYTPDTNENPYAYLEDGFNESDFAFMPDGSVVIVMRVNSVGWGGLSWSPLYFSRSTDMGKTWSKPHIFAKAGVLPRMCTLPCGTTLIIYGRPGIFVRATDDPHGLEWSTPLEVMTPNNRSHLRNQVPEGRPTFHQYAGSCCNCSIAPIDDHTAIIAYSDFYYPDETGLKRKTILTQIVTVS